MLNKFIKKIKSKVAPTKSVLEEYIERNQIDIGKNSIVKNFNVKIRKNDLIKTYLKIGLDSVISGNFIFENEKGYISIGDRTFIGGGKFISADNISIGNDVLISWGCTFIDNNAHSLNWSERSEDVLDWKRGIELGEIGHYKKWENVKRGKIIIKDKVWIGFESVILKGVTIGEGAVVGSRSVVTKDVQDWSIVAGNPAQIVRIIPEDER